MSSAHCGTQNTGSSRAKVPDVGVVGEGFLLIFLILWEGVGRLRIKTTISKD